MIDQAFDIPGLEIFPNYTQFLIPMINLQILVLTGFSSFNGLQTPSNYRNRLWKTISTSVD